MITIEHLSKTFIPGKKIAPVVAVDDLSLTINRGEVFGLLGPNGAGKTTTIRMLACLIAPTSGSATVNGLCVGKDNEQIRRSIGILTETPGMYDRLSAEKNLSIYARLYGVQDVNGQVEKYLRMLGLWDRRQDEAGSFSKGMRQKLAIARALLHEPEILFLDEPTSGLDPEASHLVREFIESLKSQGRTLILCTHNLNDADRLCDRVGIFKTRLVVVDSPANLRDRLFGQQVIFHLEHIHESWLPDLKALPFVQEVSAAENKLMLRVVNPDEDNPRIIRLLVEKGAGIQFVGLMRRPLEDIYLQLIHTPQP